MTKAEKEVYQRAHDAFHGHCALCGRTDIQMHHIRYGAGGRKTYDGNVIPLCLGCHEMVHTSHKKWMPVLIGLIDAKLKKEMV